MFSKLKQIKDLRQQAKQMKSSLAGELTEGTAAWGKIKIQMDGNQEVKKISIDQELLKPDKKTDLENGVKEAFNDAVKKVHKIMAAKFRETGGLEKLGLK